jgi:hypothetical protein
MATTKDRVMYAADTAKPYLGRAFQDEEFRDNLRAAFAAARAIYDELSRQRGVSSIAATAATDEEIHANLRRSIKELQQAADRLQDRRAEKSHTFRNIALIAVGIAIGIFFNPFTGPTARRWVTRRAGGSSDGYSPNSST